MAFLSEVVILGIRRPFELEVRSKSEDVLGADVPIPTFALSPSTIELLWLTLALYPIAVAFIRFGAVTSAKEPNPVLCRPSVLVDRAALPLAVL